MKLVLVESGGSVWVLELGGTADEDAVIAERSGDSLPPRPRPVELLPAFVSESRGLAAAPSRSTRWHE